MNEDQDTTDYPSKDERTWGMLCHAAAFAGYLFPFGSVFGPLIIWLIKKDEMPFVDDHGKESLNFQLTILIGLVVSAILLVVVVGFFLGAAIIIYQILMTVVAIIKANDGVMYRYPYTIRFIK